MSQGQRKGIERATGSRRDRLAEETLPAAARRFWLLFERNLAGVIRYRPDGVVLACNEAFARLLGYSPAELQGRCAWGLSFDAADRDGVLSELFEQGSLPTRERRFRRKDGSTVEVLVNLDLAREAGREVIQCVALDVSERKRLEETRAEVARREQEAHAAARTAHRWLSFLSEASKLLAASLDYRVTLMNVAQLAMPFLCDWCSVDILEEGGAGSVLRLAPCQPGSLRLVWRDGIRYARPPSADSPHPLAAVLATGRSRVVGQLAERSLLEPDQPPSSGSACAVIVPLPIRGKVQGAFVLVSSDGKRRFGPGDLSLAEDLGRRVASAIDNARLVCEARGRERELHALAARLALAEDKGRRRLALDLHDSIGQTLSVLKLNLEAGADPPRLAAALHLLQEVIAQVRTMTFDLYPAMLDDLGLAPALHWYAEQFKAQTGILAEVSETGRPFPLSAGMAGSLFRVVKELLANVAKHAGAREVVVALRWEQRLLRLVVADDGCGFEAARVWPPASASGLGLLSIRERIAALRGQVLVESEPGLGTRVIVEAPREDLTAPSAW
jgi:PAS domain S-box-containing protein